MAVCSCQCALFRLLCREKQWAKIYLIFPPGTVRAGCSDAVGYNYCRQKPVLWHSKSCRSGGRCVRRLMYNLCVHLSCCSPFALSPSLLSLPAQHLVEKSWYMVLETFILLAGFHEDMQVGFVTTITFLFVIKAFHWLIEERINYVRRSPHTVFISLPHYPSSTLTFSLLCSYRSFLNLPSPLLACLTFFCRF